MDKYKIPLFYGENMSLDNDILKSVTGKPASTVTLGQIVPSFFGKTELSITKDSIIENTKKIVSSRESRVLLQNIDSADICVKGNPIFLILGFITLPFYGIGLIFLVLYFLLKDKFLVIYSNANANVVCIKGQEDEYRDFYESVLASTKAINGIHRR